MTLTTQKEKAALGIAILWLSGCGCPVERGPSLAPHAIRVPASVPGPDVTWTVTNLMPDETAVLVDGHEQTVSIDAAVKGIPLDGARYELRLQTSHERFRPFKITTTGNGEGELDFSGTISWPIRITGSAESVVVSLYRLVNSASGRTIEQLLLHSISRSYPVVRHRHGSLQTR